MLLPLPFSPPPLTLVSRHYYAVLITRCWRHAAAMPADAMLRQDMLLRRC